MSVITISSSFGTGGSVIATQVGAILGWRVINRAIPVTVAERLDIPIEIADTNDEQLPSPVWRTLIRSAVQLVSEGGAHVPREVFLDEERFRFMTESVIEHLAETSDSVIVGRAAAIILRDRPDALHVRFDGPQIARTRQGMIALQLTSDEAHRLMTKTDRARREYVRRLYKRDWADPGQYHLVADSTVFSLETCARLVVEAAVGRGLTTGAARTVE